MKLPIGIQSFETIRTDGYIYIDKTPFIARMVNLGKPYFLSRPRRFGKSLLLDTMDQAFSGRRELFAGLYLDTPESQWDWSRTNPVLRFDFSTGDSWRAATWWNRCTAAWMSTTSTLPFPKLPAVRANAFSACSKACRPVPALRLPPRGEHVQQGRSLLGPEPAQ
ncbi:MAG: AAA family ATPase [Rectinemataceae bacterium]